MKFIRPISTSLKHSSSSGPLIIRGVRKISNSLRIVVRESYRKSCPKIGISPSMGALRAVVSSRELIMPPMTIVLFEGTRTVVLTLLISVIRWPTG